MDFFRQPDTPFFRQQTQSLRERDSLDQHYKLEDIASFTAAEAVENLPGRVHCKRGRLFAVKGTQTRVIHACLAQWDIFAHDANDVGCLTDPFYLGTRHDSFCRLRVAILEHLAIGSQYSFYPIGIAFIPLLFEKSLCIRVSALPATIRFQRPPDYRNRPTRLFQNLPPNQYEPVSG